MKRILSIILALVVIAAAGVGIAISRLDPETVHARLADITRTATGKPLYLAETPQITVIPLGVTFGAASWGMTDGKPAAEGVSVAVKSGAVRLELMPLLSGRMVLEEVRLDSPQVTLRPPKINAISEGAHASSPDTGSGRSVPLELARLSISNGEFLLEMAPGQTVRIEGFNASVTDLHPGAEATIKVDMGIASTSPALDGNLALAAHVRQDGDTVTVRQGKLTFTPLKGLLLATVTLAGNLAVGLGAVPSVRGTVQVGDVTLAAPPSEKATPSVTAQPVAAGSSVYPTVDVDIQVESLTAGKVTLKQLRAHVRGEGGRSVQYVVDPVGWTFSSGGTVQGSAGAALPAMRYTAVGKVRELAVGPLLQAVQGIRPADGLAEADYNIACVGVDAAAIKGSLTGKGEITVRDIRLNGVSILPKAVPVKGGVPSHFERMHVPFTIQNGVITVPGMTLTGQGLSADGKGVVRLPQDSLDMTASVRTLGLQVPLIIKGPFKDISYGVDPKWAARALLQTGGSLMDGSVDAGKKAGKTTRDLGGAVRGVLGR